MRKIRSLLHKTALFTAAAVALAISPLEKIVSKAEAQAIVPEVEWTMPLYTAPAEGEYPVVYDVDKDGVDDILFANGNLLIIDRDTGNVKKTIDVGEAVYQPTPYNDVNGDAMVLVRGNSLHVVNPKNGTVEWQKGVNGRIVSNPSIREINGTQVALFGNSERDGYFVNAINLGERSNFFEPFQVNNFIHGITFADIDGSIYVGINSGDNNITSSFYILNQNGELTPGGLQQVNPLNTPPSSANGKFLFGTWGPIENYNTAGTDYEFEKQGAIWNITTGFSRPLSNPVRNVVVPVQADNDPDLETIVITTQDSPNYEYGNQGTINILNNDGSYVIPPIPIGRPVNNISVFGDYIIIPTLYNTETKSSGALEIRNMRTGELAAAPFLASQYSQFDGPVSIYKTSDNEIRGCYPL